jgi:peroxiredoxin
MDEFPMKKFAIPLIGLALLAGLAYVLLAKQAAPALTFSTLKGEKIALESLRGKVVLVNFWATSCPGCVREMPELVRTYEAYRGRGFEIVAVAMSYDPPNYVLTYANTHRLPFPVALDIDGAAARAFGDVRLTPTAFLIGKDGTVMQQTLGELDFAKLRATLDAQLAG